MANSKKPSAKLMDGKKSTNIDIEEMPATPAPAINPPAVLTPDEKANMEVAKFKDLFPAQVKHREWIATKKEECKDLKIAGLDDKVGFKTVEKAWQDIRNTRLSVEKKHKEIKYEYLTISKAIDKEKNELVVLLEEIEKPLKDELTRIEDEKKEIETRNEREAQEKLQSRVVALMDAGMKFNGSYYAIGGTISIDAVTLKVMIDDDFNKLKEKVVIEQNNIQAEIDRIQAEKDAELLRLQEQKEAQELAQKKLLEDAAELARQKKELQDEKDAMLKTRTDARIASLEAMGMVYDYKQNWFVFNQKSIEGRAVVTTIAVNGLSLELWNAEIKTISKSILDLKEMQADADKKAKEAKDEEDRIAKDAKDTADKKAQEDKDERDRIQTIYNTRKIILEERFKMGLVYNQTFTRTFENEVVEPVLLNKDDITGYSDDEWVHVLETIESLILHGEKAERDTRIIKATEDEINRVAALSDYQKIFEYIQNVELVNGGKTLQLSNPVIKSIFDEFQTTVLVMIEELLDSVKKLAGEDPSNIIS